MSRYLAKRQPLVVLDQSTAKRQLIWAEMDANATGRANADLLIHPGITSTLRPRAGPTLMTPTRSRREGVPGEVTPRIQVTFRAA